MPGRRYCLVSPCRDEAKYLERTLASVAAQSVPPSVWVIVDDGSTDETPRILEAWAERTPWIRILRREDRGKRKVGPGVVDAFWEGFERIKALEWDYVCKLDMDLELPPRYFETLLLEMEADPRLGSASGRTYYLDEATGKAVDEPISPEMSVGASKFCRRRCFEQIGGFVRAVMWDGIDCHRARMLGWRVRSIESPEARFLHLRPMGTSHKGIWAGRRRHGYGQWYMGTGLLFVTASALYRVPRPPPFLGALALWWGYVSSALRREPRLEDPAFRRFLRRFQWRMLFQGKRRAVAAVESERAARFDPAARSPWDLGTL